MKPIEKLNELSPSATNDVDYESPSTVEINQDLMQVQLRVDEREVRKRELESKQALWVQNNDNLSSFRYQWLQLLLSRLREFENLQSECEEVSQLYQNVHELVAEQAPMVEAIAENVEVTEIHVEEGTRQLAMALNYKKTIYPLLGGFIGACVLGPVGLVAGLKAGGAASVCGGICGYAGGKFLKKANSPSTEHLPSVDKPVDASTTEKPTEAIKWVHHIRFINLLLRYAEFNDINDKLAEINETLIALSRIDDVFYSENIQSWPRCVWSYQSLYHWLFPVMSHKWIQTALQDFLVSGNCELWIKIMEASETALEEKKELVVLEFLELLYAVTEAPNLTNLKTL